MLNISETWLREIDVFLSNSTLIDMLAQEPSMTFTVRRKGREILQGQEKRKEGERRRLPMFKKKNLTLILQKNVHIKSYFT